MLCVTYAFVSVLGGAPLPHNVVVVVVVVLLVVAVAGLLVAVVGLLGVAVIGVDVLTLEIMKNCCRIDSIPFGWVGQAF